ncbi:hypothetical protein BKA59DRAFT_473061 [Fusarium tricinctum]|uniref:Secreted protein n=1 Tax=Fusarium tricinctum TaxID=61284 RepID=A0A8K0S4Q9_9HYPO|nr:hypothetical protein BKA59DRAFT_473061 [Fusarium tricinctum]
MVLTGYFFLTSIFSFISGANLQRSLARVIPFSSLVHARPSPQMAPRHLALILITSHRPLMATRLTANLDCWFQLELAHAVEERSTIFGKFP